MDATLALPLLVALIGIALALINRHNMRVCYRSTPDDAAVLVTTFIATLIALMGLLPALFLKRKHKAETTARSGQPAAGHGRT